MKLIQFSFSLLFLICFTSATSIEDIESNNKIATNDDEIALSDTTNLLPSNSLISVNQPIGEIDLATLLLPARAGNRESCNPIGVFCIFLIAYFILLLQSQRKIKWLDLFD